MDDLKALMGLAPAWDLIILSERAAAPGSLVHLTHNNCLALGSFLPLWVSGGTDKGWRGCGGWKGQWESHFLKKDSLKIAKRCLQQARGELDLWKYFLMGRRGKC